MSFGTPRTIVLRQSERADVYVALQGDDPLLEPYFLEALEHGTKPCRIEYRFKGYDYSCPMPLPIFEEYARKYSVEFRELDAPFDPDADAEAFRKSFNETHAEEKPVRQARPRGVQVYRVPELQFVHGTTCDSCGKLIIWITTRGGKRVALDFRSAIPDDGGSTMIDHYSPKVCPAGSIRRKKT